MYDLKSERSESHFPSRSALESCPQPQKKHSESSRSVPRKSLNVLNPGSHPSAGVELAESTVHFLISAHAAVLSVKQSHQSHLDHARGRNPDLGYSSI